MLTGCGSADDKLPILGQREAVTKVVDGKSVTDSTAPGGVVHSGAFILVDKAKHIRGIYDGTTEAGVDKLMIDIDRLLAEYN